MRGVEAGEVGASALVLLPFVVALFALFVAQPATEAQLAVADPLVQLAGPLGGPIAVPFVALVVAAAAVWKTRPRRVRARAAVVRAGMGAGLAALVLVLLRLVVGPHMPSFVPPEESAKPGLLLGLSAGVVEEALFRILVLPATYFTAVRLGRLRPGAAAAVAVALTGLSFALSHELGPGAGELELRYFVTRAMIPGALMSVFFFRPGPSFIVAAHCTAHVIIPALFA